MNANQSKRPGSFRWGLAALILGLPLPFVLRFLSDAVQRLLLSLLYLIYLSLSSGAVYTGNSIICNFRM